MKYASAAALFATPALAHDGPHLHPHGIETWMVGLALLALAGAVAIAVKVRK